MDKPKQQICREVESMEHELFAVSDFLLQNPEIAYQEFKACEHLSAVLEQNGFEVQKRVGNVETSFLAKPADCRPSRPELMNTDLAHETADLAGSLLYSTP